MTFVDITLLVLLGGFVLAGLWFGAIHMVGSLVGLILGAILSGRYYDEVGAWAAPWFGGNVGLANIVMFFVIFVLTTRLVGLLVWLPDQALHFLGRLSFLQ